jgi:hypothetical protein
MKNYTINKLAMSLFSCILAEGTENRQELINGVVVHGKFLGSPEQVLQFIDKAQANELSKTFYAGIEEFEQNDGIHLLQAIMNYLTGYGTDFTGKTYIPNKFFGAEGSGRVPVVFVSAISRDELVHKAVYLLNSGIALGTETVNEAIDLLEALGYCMADVTFKNQEATALLDAKFNRVARNVPALLKQMLASIDDSALLVKNAEVIAIFKAHSTSMMILLEEFIQKNDIVTVAQSFNRYKPFFLAIKRANPKLINKVSKLSKKNHVTMPTSPINLVTSEEVEGMDFTKVSTFALLRAVNAIKMRLSLSPGDPTIYTVRTGRSFVKEALKIPNIKILNANRKVLMAELKKRVTPVSVYIPTGIDYALPTSEKSFVGGIPSNTIFSSNKPTKVGVYWENGGGATDLDLSGVGILGTRVGWGGHYGNSNDISYSGDITDAPTGATEYMSCGLGMQEDYLINLNVYYGSEASEYKLLFGSSDCTEQYLNPEDLLFSVPMVTEEKQTGLGVVYAENKEVKFSVVNIKQGAAAVSSGNEITTLQVTALVAKSKHRESLDSILMELGFEVTDNPLDDVDVDLHPNTVTKESLVNLFG